MSKRSLLAGLLLAAVTLSSRAFADASPEDRAAADALYEEAGKLAAADRWGEACPKLEASFKLDPAIGTLLRLGYCYEKVGRTASAWASFNDGAAMAIKANDKRAKDAAEGVRRLAPTLARLAIEVAPENGSAGLDIRRDGTVVSAGALGTPVPVDPGTHTVEASQAGKRAWTVGRPATDRKPRNIPILRRWIREALAPRMGARYAPVNDADFQPRRPPGFLAQTS